MNKKSMFKDGANKNLIHPKLGLIIGIVAVIVGILIFISTKKNGGIVGLGNSEVDKYNIQINADENIDVKAYITNDDKTLTVYIKNKNKFHLANPDKEMKFYDEKGEEISWDMGSVSMIFTNGEYVTRTSLPRNENNQHYIPYKTVINVKIDKSMQELYESGNTTHDESCKTNFIETSYKIEKDQIISTIKNKSDVKIDSISAIHFLFIKNNKIIWHEFERAEDNYIVAQDSTTVKIDIPTDKSLEFIEFDSLKIVVNEASVY